MAILFNISVKIVLNALLNTTLILFFSYICIVKLINYLSYESYTS